MVFSAIAALVLLCAPFIAKEDLSAKCTLWSELNDWILAVYARFCLVVFKHLSQTLAFFDQFFKRRRPFHLGIFGTKIPTINVYVGHFGYNVFKQFSLRGLC